MCGQASANAYAHVYCTWTMFRASRFSCIVALGFVVAMASHRAVSCLCRCVCGALSSPWVSVIVQKVCFGASVFGFYRTVVCFGPALLLFWHCSVRITLYRPVYGSALRSLRFCCLCRIVPLARVLLACLLLVFVTRVRQRFVSPPVSRCTPVRLVFRFLLRRSPKESATLTAPILLFRNNASDN
jgi:hypothetical protein